MNQWRSAGKEERFKRNMAKIKAMERREKESERKRTKTDRLANKYIRQTKLMYREVGR